ncbi:hypothetical protein [Klebsiella michiganensis]|uniref:hypothetical protein n=1 Tax=Klebsiella michiganensis TaxID=1134687 RepID=UPI0031E41326
MNISTVNELIQSLESAGELSIKETKVMALAKAFKQLAAENVALKDALTGRAYINFIKANGWNASASTVNGKFVNFADPEVDFGSMVFAHAKKLIESVETPATDAYLAGLKADGVEEWVSSRGGRWNGTTEEALKFAKQLRGVFK